MEAMSIKKCLYGFDEAINSSHIVICEGPTNVWRGGSPCVATFGTGFTTAQLCLIAENWTQVGVLFDADDAGVKAGKKLARSLEMLGVEKVVRVELGPEDFGKRGGKDLADMQPAKAKAIMDQIGRMME
jgi:DNA primase